jgi:hypothetical protein
MNYDTRVQIIENWAEENGFTVLVPASNTVIVKESVGMKRQLEAVVSGLDGASITWTENTAEITVNR